MDVRTRLAPAGLPSVAERSPHRGCYVAEAAGRYEVFAWDLATGTGRQVTDRPGPGTRTADIDPPGEAIWWFDDDLAGVGRWRMQPWAGGPDRAALPDIGPGTDAGLAMAADGTAAVGLSAGGRFSVHLRRPDGTVRTVLSEDGHAELVDLAADGTVLAVATEPTGAAAVRIVDRTGRVLATVSGQDGPVWALGFRPTDGEAALLLVAEWRSRYRLAVWTPRAGLREQDWCSFDTEVSAGWCPDGRVLLRQDRHGRSTVSRLDLDRRECDPVPTPAGTVLDARVLGSGDLLYLWTDSTTPPQLRSASGVLPRELAAPPPAGPEVARLRERWAPGPGGPVHTLLSTPADRPAPWPTVLLVHGGPFRHDRDAYDPLVTVLTSLGYAVARANYRGSTGYGPAWQGAFDDGVGLTQVADLEAVRADLVGAGLADRDGVAVAGWSWGGYLALLALGARPALWRAGAAVYPVADYVAAYRATTPALRSLDTRLFGGTPEQVPERYARSSPMTYAAAVRAPVLLVSGRSDPRCPPEQVAAYAAALRAHGRRPRLVELESGHGGHDVDSGVAPLLEVVRFLADVLPATSSAEAAGSAGAHSAAAGWPP